MALMCLQFQKSFHTSDFHIFPLLLGIIKTFTNKKEVEEERKKTQLSYLLLSFPEGHHFYIGTHKLLGAYIASQKQLHLTSFKVRLQIIKVWYLLFASWCNKGISIKRYPLCS